jgi:hypothetical protein
VGRPGHAGPYPCGQLTANWQKSALQFTHSLHP